LQQNDNNHTQRSKKHTNSKPVLSNIGHGSTMVDFGLFVMLNIGHGGTMVDFGLSVMLNIGHGGTMVDFSAVICYCGATKWPIWWDFGTAQHTLPIIPYPFYHRFHFHSHPHP
jgi:hypothetical protein